MTPDIEARAREIVEKHVSYTDLGPDAGLLMTVDDGNGNALISAIASAIAEERERCAKIVDDSFGRYTSLKREKEILAAVAAAIRNQKET